MPGDHQDHHTAETRTSATGHAEKPAPDGFVGPEPGDTIGRYRLVRPLGEGGFGTVWRAEQTEPVVRQVALKLLKPGMDSRAVLARFEAERQALAVMDHECIARVFDGGATDRGLPYFVMELVEGEPITHFCDRHRLSVGKRLSLFVRVCQAVQHAHAKGVIHRDLKPSNILVFMDAQGVAHPRVIDFGIAKALREDTPGRTVFTQQGQLIGTPEYMSPEQADPSCVDIDTRTDVYALGVVLYELLTGRRPFDARTLRDAAIGEIQRVIREVDPPRPSTRLASARSQDDSDTARVASDRGTRVGTLVTALRRDLDWVVMRCLEKQRERRYASPSQLAEDVGRYLACEPVEAGPPSAAYRASKFVRRHRVGVAVAAMGLAALVLGGGGAGAGLVAAVRANADLRAQKEATERELTRAREVKGVISDMLLSIEPDVAELADVSLMLNTLAAAEQRLDSGELTDPLIRAELHLLIGRAYLSIGRTEDAGRHLPEARAIRERVLGADDPETIIARTYDAHLRTERGEFEEAAALLEGILADRRRVLGEDAPLTAASMHNLAGVYLELWRLDEAEALSRDAVEIARSHGEAGDRDRVLFATRLGITLADQDRVAESEELLRDVAEESARLLGPTDPLTLNAAHELSIAILLQGRRDEAIELFRVELDQYHRVFGPVHPFTIVAAEQLGETLLGGGRFAESETVLRDRVGLALRELAPDHPSVERLLGRIDRLYEQWALAGGLGAQAARGEWRELSERAAAGVAPDALPDPIASE